MDSPISSRLVLFFLLGYLFGTNYQLVMHYIKTYDEIVIDCIIVLILAFISRFWWKHLKHKSL